MRSISTLKHVAAIVLLLLANVACAQFQEPPKTMPSPNAASLGTYGEVPVSLYTGVPQVSIPLYTAIDGSIQVPVSLSYHAGGVRIDQHPGWVGLNFNLNAGGNITRTVKDVPDDAGITLNGFVMGFVGNHEVLNTNGWWTKSYMMDFLGGSGSGEFLLDTEPDEFQFNFMGYSGSFYMDCTSPVKFKVRSDQNFKVELLPDELHPNGAQMLRPPFLAINSSGWFRSPNEESYMGHFGGFKLIAEDGTQFIFGGTTSAVEYSISFFNQHTDTWTANTWNLVRIIARDGREVSFNHERGPFINQMYYSVMHKTKIVSGSHVEFGDGFLSSSGDFTPNCVEFSSGTPPTGVFNGKLIAPVYLKDIQLSDGSKISFSRSATTELRYDKPIAYDPMHDFRVGFSDYRDYLCFLIYDQQARFFDTSIPYADVFNSLEWHKLDKIEVTDRDNQNIAQYVFNYTNDPDQRLTLKSLLLLDVASQQGNQEYKFFYDTSLPLPRYLVSIGDHYGFYNGMSSPIAVDAWNLFHLYKEPDKTFLKAGILNKIVYPTGGVTEFEFEANTYAKEVDVVRSNPLIVHDQNKDTGGLRIAKITSYDPLKPAEKLVTQYLYVSGYDPQTGSAGLSSGVLGGRAQYYWPEFKTVVNDSDPPQVVTEEVFSSSSLLPMSQNSEGSHIGYTEVVEKFSNGGAVVHTFSNFDNGYGDELFIRTLHESQTPYEPYTSKAFTRGKLLRKETYDAQGDKLESRVYQYAPLRRDSVRAVRITRTLTCAGSFQAFAEGTSYKIYTYPFSLMSELVRTYDVTVPAKFLDLTTAYAYNDENLPEEIRVSKSGNREVVTKLLYPMDFNLTGADDNIPNIAALKMLQEKHILNEVIEKYTYQVNEHPLHSAPFMLSATYASHRKNEANTAQVVTDELFELELPGHLPLQGFLPSNVVVTQRNSHYKPKMKFNRYDNFGNVIEYTPASGTPVSFQWGYNKRLPVARVENAGASQFFYTSFEEGDGNSAAADSHTGMKSRLNGFSKTLDIPAAGTYELSYWKKMTSGKWEHFSQLDNISGPTFTFTLEGQVDEVRFYPQGALMTTFTFSPGIGMTSSTDANSQTTYFEYDGLRRTKRVRDDDRNIVKRYDYQLRKP